MSLALGSPALAAPPPPGCKPVQGKPAYPPGQCKPITATSSGQGGVGVGTGAGTGAGTGTGAGSGTGTTTATGSGGGASGIAGLPFTGFELGAASLLGVALLGAGAVTVVSGRKRNNGSATAA